MGHPFKVEVDTRDAVTVVSLVGDGDAHSVGAFKQGMAPVLDAAPAEVVVDLSRLTFAASLLIGRLMVVAGELKAKGCSMKLAAARPVVAEVLQIGGFDKIVPTFDTLEAAMG